MKSPYTLTDLHLDPAYFQTCAIRSSGSKLGDIRYHTYSTNYTPEEQLKHKRTIFCHVIVCMLKGETHLNWGEYEDIVIKAGDIYFLPRGAEVSGYIVGEVSYIEIMIDRQLSNKEIDDLRKMREHEDFDRYTFNILPMRPVMQRYVESLEGYLLNGVNCPHLLESKFAELMVILHWYYSQKENALFFYPMAESISSFRELIISNYKISSTIQDLVELTNMSRSNFDRKFKETFQTTPHKWIETQLLQVIIHKASEPKVTIKDLMHEVKIYDQSQFSHLCKRLCGMPPSELIRSQSIKIKM